MQVENAGTVYHGNELDEDTIRRTLTEEIKVSRESSGQSILSQKEAELKALEQRDRQIKDIEDLLEKENNTQEK